MAVLPAGAVAFIGREAELAVLRSCIERARAGHGGVTLVAGEPGMGKTRLIEEVAVGLADAGIHVVWGRCHEGDPGGIGPGGAPSFWPWVQVLRSLLAQRNSVAPPATWAPPDQLASVAQLLPELRTLLEELPAPPALAPAQARFYLFDAISTCLQRITGALSGPLVIVLEYLHWADPASLQLLEFIARDPSDGPLLLVGTYRDSDMQRGRPLEQMLGELVRWPHVTRLALPSLSVHEVSRMVEAAMGTRPPAALVTVLLRQTDGNPLFLTEMLRLLASEERLTGGAASADGTAVAVPPTLRAVIARRLDRLSTECSRALTLAAIVGREFDLGLLELAGGSEGGALLDALDEAEQARVIVAVPEIPGRFRFTHALIGQTLSESLSSVQRMRLHAAIAGALAQRSGDESEHLAELAHHFHQAAPAGDAGQAVAYARRAGEHARRQLAFEDAARFCEMALQALALAGGGVEGERCEILLALGEARNRTGEIVAAKEAFRGAAVIARRLGSARALARAALGYGGDGFAPGLLDDTLPALLDDALASLGDEDGALRARLLARRSQTLYWSNEQGRQAALSGEAVALARRSGDDAAAAYALAARCVTLRAPDQTDELVATASELIQLADRAGDAEMRFWGHRWRLRGLLERGEIAAADAEIAAHMRLAEELRQPYFRWYATMLRATRALLEGAFDEAERLAVAALEAGEGVKKEEAEPYFLLHTYYLRREQGRLAEVEERLRQAVAEGVPSWGALLALVYSEHHATHDAARAEIDRLAAQDTAGLPYGFPRDGDWLAALVFLADACASLGDAEHATRLYDLLLPYETRNAVAASSGPCHGAVARALGRLAAVLHRWTVAAQHFETALRLNTAMGAHAWVARTRYEYAAMQLNRMSVGRERRGAEHGDLRTVVALLDDAIAAGRRLGMPALVQQATSLRARMHDRPVAVLAAVPSVAPPPVTPRTTLPDGLTARELEVLRLLAAGLSNPEIAARLVVSRKTVQQHTVNLYRKIRARGRMDAAAYAFRNGLTLPPTELD